MAEKTMAWQPLAVKNLADLKRAIKPGVEIVTIRHALHPDLIGLVRVVGKVQTNGFYSTIKDQPDHKWSACNGGKGVWTPFEKAASYIFDGQSFKVLGGGDADVLFEVEIRDMKARMSLQKSDGHEREESEPIYSEAEELDARQPLEDTASQQAAPRMGGMNL